MQKVSIVDYGLANIRSVVNALECFDVDVEVAEAGSDLSKADKIVLPGVGSFDAGMQGLWERGHVDALNELVLEKHKPFLGICLGLQFCFEGSDEGEESGLGWLPLKCRRFPSGPDKPKVPHMGWSDVEVKGERRLFSEMHPPFTFYFVHSYYAPSDINSQEFTAAVCEYGLKFIAAVEKDNIYACQFHPEKSQLAGMKLLETFLRKL